MKRIIMGAVLTILAAPLTLAQTTPQKTGDPNAVEQKIKRVEEERRQAILRNDTNALDRLIAPEFTGIFNHLCGRVGTKADELAVNESGTRKIQLWDHSDVKVRLYGNVGLVTGLAEVIDILKGERRHIRFRYTHVWVERDGRWLLVHRHTTRVATIEGPAPPC